MHITPMRDNVRAQKAQTNNAQIINVTLSDRWTVAYHVGTRRRHLVFINEFWQKVAFSLRSD